MVARTIRPIETRFRGCRFRSRLEARWAVFFEQLEVPWSYEAEGFDLGDGVYYLPDFWLATWGMFVEVKPLGLEKAEYGDAARKMILLARQASRPVLYLEGEPWPEEHSAIVTPPLLGDAFERHVRELGHLNQFAECALCDGLYLIRHSRDEAACAELGGGYAALKVGPHTCGGEGYERFPRFGPVEAPLVFTSYARARGARFEHGETGG